MLRRSMPWLLVLLALLATVLITLRPAVADDATATTSVSCVYLPVVGDAYPGPSGGSQQVATAAAGDCPLRPDPPPATLSGAVQLRPEHRVVEQTHQPIQYVVVLDQSGSMSANFHGQCDHNSSSNPNPPPRSFYGEPAAFWQCTNGPLYDSDGDGVGDTAVTDRVTGVGTTYYWANRNERRITVAKKAIETLIRTTRMPGNPGYTADAPDDQMALVWFTERAQRNGNSEVFANGASFSNQPTELIAKMWSRTTSSRGDVSLTEGGTNATAGLYRAFLLLNAAPTEVVGTDGRTYRYRKVVLLITDGVTNQFFHEAESDLQVRQSDTTTYAPGSPCKALGSLVIEDAGCQTTAVGGVYTTTVMGMSVGLDRPITQMVKVSQGFLQQNGYLVSVLALSHVSPLGLSSGVPSYPNYFSSVPDLILNQDGSSNVEQTITTMPGLASVVETTCQAVIASAYVTTMTEAHRPDLQTPAFPNVGEVQIVNTVSGASYMAPIIAATDGTLSYTVANLPPGIYTLTAQLWYRGDDGVTRAYETFEQNDELTPTLTVDVTGTGVAQLNLMLRLDGDVCAD